MIEITRPKRYKKQNKYAPTKNAIIFMRVSTKDQEDGYSLDAQKTNLERYCTEKGLNIIKEFRVIESSTVGGRKQFFEMLNFVKQQKQHINIVCDTVDRLQRGFKELPLLDELRCSGKITLHFQREKYQLDKDSKSSDFLLYHLHIVMAENYVKTLADNVKRSFKKCRELGVWTHQAPIGYLNARTENNETTIKPDKEQAWIIKRMFEMYAQGTYSLADIKRWAQEQGLRTCRGKVLTDQTTRNILDNPFYCGTMICNDIPYKHRYETLISEDLFNQCQAVLNKKMNHKLRKHKHLFQGLIHCGSCGRLITTDVKGKSGQYKYLFCPSCKGNHTKEGEAVRAVKTVLKALTGLKEKQVAGIIDKINKQLDVDNGINKEEIRAYKKRLTEVKTQKETLLDLRLDKSITPEQYTKKLNQLNAEEEKLKALLVDKNDDEEREVITLKSLMCLVLRLEELFDFSNFDQKRQIIKLLSSKICLQDGNICFYCKKAIENILSTASFKVWRARQDSNLQPSDP